MSLLPYSHLSAGMIACSMLFVSLAPRVPLNSINSQNTFSARRGHIKALLHFSISRSNTLPLSHTINIIFRKQIQTIFSNRLTAEIKRNRKELKINESIPINKFDGKNFHVWKSQISLLSEQEELIDQLGEEKNYAFDKKEDLKRCRSMQAMTT